MFPVSGTSRTTIPSTLDHHCPLKGKKVRSSPFHCAEWDKAVSVVPSFMPWFHNGLLLPTRSHPRRRERERKALHGEGLSCLLGDGATGDWIGLNWGVRIGGMGRAGWGVIG